MDCFQPEGDSVWREPFCGGQLETTKLELCDEGKYEKAVFKFPYVIQFPGGSIYFFVAFFRPGKRQGRTTRLVNQPRDGYRGLQGLLRERDISGVWRDGRIGGLLTY